MKKKVRNISDEILTLDGVGVVNPSEEVLVSEDFHNANFAEVENSKSETRRTKIQTESESITNDKQ